LHFDLAVFLRDSCSTPKWCYTQNLVTGKRQHITSWTKNVPLVNILLLQSNLA